MEENLNTVQERQDDKKQLIIDQLRKTPIIELTCKKTNLSRATFYRWRKDDLEFAQKVEQALDEGLSTISDLAESKLISAIQNENFSAIAFWLKAHHPAYKTKIEVSTEAKPKEELTPEQQQLVKKALEMGEIIPTTEDNNKSYGQQSSTDQR